MRAEITIGKTTHYVDVPSIEELTIRQAKALIEADTEHEKLIALGVPEDVAFSMSLPNAEELLAAYDEFMVAFSDVKPSSLYKVTFDGVEYGFPISNEEVAHGQCMDIDGVISASGITKAIDSYPVILGVLANDGTPYGKERSARNDKLIEAMWDAPAVTAFAVCGFFSNGVPRWTARLRQRIPNWPLLDKPESEATHKPS